MTSRALIPRLLSQCTAVQVDAKHAMPRTESTGYKATNQFPDSVALAGMRKIFVGGLPPGVADVVLRTHFEQYGEVEDAVVMMDHHSKRSRGFGFVTFKDEATVDQIMHTDSRPVLFGKAVEVKRAVPREQLQNGAMMQRRRPPASFYPGPAGYGPVAGQQFTIYPQQQSLQYPANLQPQPGVLNAAMHPYYLQQEHDVRTHQGFAAPPAVHGATGSEPVWALGEQARTASANAMDPKTDIRWQPDARSSSPMPPIQNVGNLSQFGSYPPRPAQDHFYDDLDPKTRSAFPGSKAEPHAGSPGHVADSFENFASSLGAALPPGGGFMHS